LKARTSFSGDDDDDDDEKNGETENRGYGRSREQLEHTLD
jgi:hypothetical protein